MSLTILFNNYKFDLWEMTYVCLRGHVLQNWISFPLSPIHRPPTKSHPSISLSHSSPSPSSASPSCLSAPSAAAQELLWIQWRRVGDTVRPGCSAVVDWLLEYV
ncbi:hypothetical protein Bca4012_008744 [Brassica carinata]